MSLELPGAGPRLKRALALLKRSFVTALALAALLYGGDYAVARFRVAKNLNPYGTVRVRRDYAVTTKSGKAEYYFDQPTDQTCLHALFPHFSYPPCWYLQRKTTQEVKM